MSSAEVSEEDVQAVVDVVRSGRLALGENIVEFERAVADYAGAKHAIAVSSGTAALHLIARSIGLRAGDEVITTPFSFVASTNCFLYEGATPVFVDIEPDTYCLDPDLIEAAITPKTKAILAVDVFGHPADWGRILDIAARHELEVIADTCESIGATYKGKRTGPWGAGGAFAFYPNKQMTTGEGGVIVTNRDDVNTLSRSMANQGRDAMGAWLAHPRLGFNYRMDEMSAALGLSQLRRLDSFVSARREVVACYNQALTDDPRVRLPAEKPWASWSPFVYVVTLTGSYKRDAVISGLAKRGIPSRGYFSPIHKQEYIRELTSDRNWSLPVTEDVVNRTVALPFHNRLSTAGVERVARALQATLDDLC